MNAVLWWVIGIVIALVVAGALAVELYSGSVRRREKRLSHRPKRRIEL